MNPSATLDRDTVRLSDSVRVTLHVEGEAPLRVVLPKEPLDDASSAVWRARPVGAPAVEDLPGGRQKWSVTYRVDPYAPGEALPLTFAPARAFAGTDPQPKELSWPPLTVRVVTGVRGDIAEARPVTGVEDVRGTPSGSAFASGWGFTVLGAVVLAGIWLLARWVRRRPNPVAPAQRALADLDRLSRADFPDGAFATGLSDAVRTYVERTTVIPAMTFTTSELRTELEKAAARPPELLAELGAVLGRCDEAKFAGSPLPDADRAAMIEAARRFITWTLPPPPQAAPCTPPPPAAPS